MLISMNLSSERKHSMKSLLTVISLALAFVSPAFAGIEWGFDTGPATRPTSPYGVSADLGSGLATITLGSFGTGYHFGNTVPWNSFDGATGMWDLGKAGSIVISGLSGNGLTTLRVFEWVDTGIYNGALGYAVSGGPSGTLSPVVPVTGVGWWEYTANLGSLNPAQVTITAPGGAIINQLTLVPEPATMIAGAILLVPFALSTWPILRRKRTN